MSEIGFGLWMTVVGMGIVFAMLAVLMLLLKGVGWLDARADRAAPRVQPEPVRRDEPADEPTKPGELTDELIAAITVAVLAHTRVRRGQAAPLTRQAAPGSHLFASRWVAAGRTRQNNPWK